MPATFSFILKSAIGGKTISAIGTAKATMYGQALNFTWKNSQDIVFNPVLNCIAIPWAADVTTFMVSKCQSPYCHVEGKSPLQNSWWTLPVAVLDVANPIVAEGNGGVVLQCGTGMSAIWTNLENGQVSLKTPFIIGAPSILGIMDMTSTAQGASQHMDLWMDEGQKMPTTVDMYFLKQAAFSYTCVSTGDELIITACNADFNVDRPVKVNGEPFPVRGKGCLVMFAVNVKKRFVYIYDDNVIFDNLPAKGAVIKPVAIALENALFTVSPVVGVILFGKCDEKWEKVTAGSLFMSFALYSYIPTLPDPYIANIRIFDRLYSQTKRGAEAGDPAPVPLLLLLCAVLFKDNGAAADSIDTSFHFGDSDLPEAPKVPETKATTVPPVKGTTVEDTKVKNFSELFAQAPVAVQNIGRVDTKAAAENVVLKSTAPVTRVATKIAAPPPPTEGIVMQAMSAKITPDYQQEWDDKMQIPGDAFALLDVSSKANQMGISFGTFGDSRITMMRTANMKETGTSTMVATPAFFPFVVQGMEVKASSMFVRAFMLPQIAWEPMRNLTDPADTSTGPKPAMDPLLGMQYFSDDGGPTRLFNNSNVPVSLAPIPRVQTLIDDFKANPTNYTVSHSTLPFGLRTLSFISRNFKETIKPDISNLQPTFRTDLTGGIQLKLQAGNHGKTDKIPANNDDMLFPGFTIQVNNLHDGSGAATFCSTLGEAVTKIFNNEFFKQSLDNFNSNLTANHDLGKALGETRGVPVSRIDLSGYGANTFSNWLSPTAAFAQTSQAEFQIMKGRTAHEVIQVKSVLYPWGIKVVRTITLFRASSGYIYRTDSGWRAQSDGLFDFTYKYKPLGSDTLGDPVTPYEVHPGIIKGVYNVRNIKDAAGLAVFKDTNTIPPNTKYVNGLLGEEVMNGGTKRTENVECSAVYFDADIEITDVVQGHKKKRVVSKQVLGYVQLAPAGVPLTAVQFRRLLQMQGGAIGASVDCVIDVNGSSQQMRVNRVDVNVSVNKANQPAFVVAVRGNVMLPKEGSWSMVQHSVGSGDVVPLPENVTVPLIREGILVPGDVIDPNVVTKNLLRIANPMDIVRNVDNSTVNFGLLQNTGTQKALFLTPSFGNKIATLLSKTPPIFSDPYRLMTGNGIFPNIGKADSATNDFGKAISMLKGNGGAKAFVDHPTWQDGGKKVLQLMSIAGAKQGMTLLKPNKDFKFDIPDSDISLIDIDGLRIYIKYKTEGTHSAPSLLNFDIDSQIDSWKGRMNNLSMVVDLGAMESLVTIRGNFDSKKGKESSYSGGDTEGLPTPELIFSDALQPVIDILQILLDISGGDYADVMNRGLKVAMGNSSDVWDYKFQADKEIPLVRFPPTDELYNSAQTPLKLEASLGVGVFFNAALKVTTNANDLLPTAGAYLKFHGGLSVLCVSVGVGSIFAVGTVDLKIGCDTKGGPSLDLDFGFGVQLVVSLPVVGSVSITFMAGVKIHLDIGEIRVTAFLLFKGQAELLGGLVGITITIEASGTVDRDIANDVTTCIAEVTFAIDISIFLIIDISFSKSWSESKQIA